MSLVLLCALATLASPAPAAERRIALVIGNSDYPVRRLVNPVNDADDLARLLVAQLGFARDDVIILRNANAEALRRALVRFEQRLKAAPGAVGLFYFSGHGAQIAGKNYLLPAKNPIHNSEDARTQGLRLTDVLEGMTGAGASIKIVVLDACRDDPFPGGSRGARGLRRENPPVGSLIAYATAADDTTDDNERERNGLYTKYLLERLAEPGLTLEQVFKRVHGDVRAATEGRQQPEVLLALAGERDFYFIPPGPDRRAEEDAAWQQVRKANTLRDYQAYLARYPQGIYADWAQSEIERLNRPSATSAAMPTTPAPREPSQVATAPQRGDYPPGKMFRDCADCPEMVVIPAGEFMMGSPENEADRRKDEGPQHKVRISQPFAVGKYEVTFVEWDACVAAGGCKHKPNDDAGWGRGKQPVMNVNWDDAQEYVAWLSKRTGKGYRLLSEAEWEYAARAGSTTAYPWGDAPGKNKANFHESGSRWSNKQTAPVGSFDANAFGLHDMIGNVWEWVQDCSHDNYNGAPTDGSAWESKKCEARVLRGGSWINNPRGARSAFRNRDTPSNRYDDSGFRLARTLP